MKKTQIQWLTLCTGACLLVGTTFAQGQAVPSTPPSSTETDRTLSDKEAGHSKQFFRTKDLIGADVKDAQGQKLGDIAEIYFNPQTGAALVAIDISGPRHAVVPLQGLTVSPPRGALHNAEVTLNKSESDLKSGPTVADNEWNKLDDASFTQQVYSHYNLQAPSAMGGAGSPGGQLKSTPARPKSSSSDQQ